MYSERIMEAIKMKYEKFRDILNQIILENTKSDLIEKIAKYPNRYIGLFRPTKPKAKILQNILQSNEIRFGDCLEIIFKKYFEELGYKNLPKNLTYKNEAYDIDQLFTDDIYVYFVEQKVRDDHDSTKKKGQQINFETKVEALASIYGEKKLRCFVYFIDDSFIKNKTFYQKEIEVIDKKYMISAKLCYGKEFWDSINHPNVWDETIEHLKRWRNEIPDFPSVNFDENPVSSFEEIKDIKISVMRKLFDNDDVCKEILPIIFPENKTLRLLADFYKNHESEMSIYLYVHEKIEKRFLNDIYHLRNN